MINFIVILIFVIIGFIVYQPLWQSAYFLEDGQILPLRVFFDQGLWSALTHSIPERPIVTATLWLNYHFNGLDPLGYRVFNVALHVITALIVLKVFRRLRALHAPDVEPHWPVILALLFMLLPVHTQAINIFSQRAVILSAMFGLLAFNAFLGWQTTLRKRDLILCGVCIVLGTLCKTTCLGFIFVFALYAALFTPRQRVGQVLKGVVGLCLLFVPAIYLYVLKVHPQPSMFNWWEYALLQIRGIFVYWKIFFLPWDLAAIRTINTDPSFFKNLTWLAALGHVGIAAGLWAIRRRFPLVTFGVGAMYCLLFLESSFFVVSEVVVDYRTYAPFVFLIALLIPLGACAGRRMLMGVAIMLMGSLGWMSYQRGQQINTAEKWAATAAQELPAETSLHYERINNALLDGDLKKVLSLAEELVARFPGSIGGETIVNLARLGQGGKADEKSVRRVLERYTRVVSAQRRKDYLAIIQLSVFYVIIDKLLPEDQQARIKFDMTYPHVLLMAIQPQPTPIDGAFSDVVTELVKRYEKTPLLTPDEEMLMHKMAAVWALMSMQGKYPVTEMIEQLKKINPNWVIFIPDWT